MKCYKQAAPGTERAINARLMDGSRRQILIAAAECTAGEEKMAQEYAARYELRCVRRENIFTGFESIPMRTRVEEQTLPVNPGACVLEEGRVLGVRMGSLILTPGENGSVDMKNSSWEHETPGQYHVAEFDYDDLWKLVPKK